MTVSVFRCPLFRIRGELELGETRLNLGETSWGWKQLQLSDHRSLESLAAEHDAKVLEAGAHAMRAGSVRWFSAACDSEGAEFDP